MEDHGKPHRAVLHGGIMSGKNHGQIQTDAKKKREKKSDMFYLVFLAFQLLGTWILLEEFYKMWYDATCQVNPIET